MAKNFKDVSPKVDFPKLEEEILKFWKEHKIFEKSVEKEAPKGDWTFLDGPPFITGMPHYGSLLSSLPKDVFPRFWTMKGYRVRRVWGWDCHGLPAENKVEVKLGLTSKKEIEEKVGVKKFIDECKLYVSEVSAEWEWYVDHIGRWVDFRNAYRTMDMPYMESVMWVFGQMYNKGFIYKGLRVSLYCPHCSTPISNFEVAMDADNYKEITDPATTYKYKLVGEENTFILAWSTTPWNKIVTPALAVNPKLAYIKVKQRGEYYILAETTTQMLEGEYEIVEKFKGSTLIGKKFEPHYDYYQIAQGEKAFEIISGDFVTSEEGTGVVTIAAYGQEDLIVMKKENVHIEMHLDEEGTIKADVPKFGGNYYLKANKLVNQDLTERGLVYKEYEYAHKVPLCWRCHTRLYYGPQNAWYVDIQKLKPLLKKTNEEVNWFPKHFKQGRFLKSLENAPDWNISRSRYWGSPVPVWECSPPAGGCGERFVPGSIAELEEASGQKITDLHKPEIDEVLVVCKKCGKKVRRVTEVLDSWIEAGSAVFAQRHYPFNKNATLEKFFPPDFIAEYTGQIRAWFYVLHVIGGALFDSMAFKNVLVEGVILGTDGRKMSKNYGNYPDPKEMIGKYGGDALRLYLLGSPVMNGEDILISEDQYRQQVKGTLLILWNVYSFFVTYANLDKYQVVSSKYQVSENNLDKWIVSKLTSLANNLTESYEGFNTVTAVAQLSEFVNILSTWYVRRSRDRIGSGALDQKDKDDTYTTLWFVLTTFSKLLAPLAPFISEEMYKNLVPSSESVHLEDWPKLDDGWINQELEDQMRAGIDLSSAIHGFRKDSGVKVKIPFKKLTYKGPKQLLESVLSIVLDEVNVVSLVYGGEDQVYTITGDASEENQDLVAGRAREIIRQIQQERKVLGTTYDELVDVEIPDWPADFEEEIKRKTLIRNISRGDLLRVLKI